MPKTISERPHLKSAATVPVALCRAECAGGGTARCRRAKQRAAANSRRLSARRAAAGGDLSEADEKLLAALYALRKRLAAKQNVPAYMVFSDATLREMVQSKPLSMDEFLNITGVGEKKAARYGMAFLRAIEDMVGSRE